VGHALAARPDGPWGDAMIRFLTGCLLAIAVLWGSMLTLGFYIDASRNHSTCLKWSTP
jgi:hypothetical protein